MIIFILNTLFNLINVIQYSLMSEDKLFFKCILIILLIFLLKIYKKYTQGYTDDPFVIANYYKIVNIYHLIFTFFVLILYFLIFICGIFFLRLTNQQKTLDLPNVLHNLYTSILSNTILYNVINIILVMLIILTYIYTIIKVLAYIRKHWVKLYIYCAVSLYKKNWYYEFKKTIIDPILPNSLLWILMDKYRFINDLSYKKILGITLREHAVIWIKNVHYLLLFIALIYDIFYCNFVLQTVYKILPYIYIYEIYIKICNLHEDVFNPYYAEYTAHAFVYATTIKVISAEEMMIDGEFYPTRNVTNAVCVYLSTGLNAELLFLAWDDEYPFCSNNYYQAWKRLRKNSTNTH